MPAVQLLGPSFLLFADETSGDEAIAIFSKGTGSFGIPLNKNTFTQVGGSQIGGPELLQINITRPPDNHIIQLYPEKELSAGPYAWGIFQATPPGTHTSYVLQVFVNGEDQTVNFRSLLSDEKADEAPIIHQTDLNDGSIYNDLDAGLLNVTWNLIGGGLKETPVVQRGQDTGGVFSGFIDSYNIRLLGGETEKWGPESFVKASKGLPVIVFGERTEPKLAVVREFGPPEIVKLVRL